MDPLIPNGIRIACVRCAFVASATTETQAVLAMQCHRQYHRWHEHALCIGATVDPALTGERPQ